MCFIFIYLCLELPPSDGLSADEERHLINAARKVGVNFSTQKPIVHSKQKVDLSPAAHKLYRPALPKVRF
jgi:hypothetical protein